MPEGPGAPAALAAPAAPTAPAAPAAAELDAPWTIAGLEPVQLTALAVSALLLAAVLELVRRGRLREEHSFVWILCSLAVIGLALWREVLHTLARWLGIHYPPALLLLLLTFGVLASSLYFSVVVSQQRQQIERLTEELALLEARLRELATALPDQGTNTIAEPAVARRAEDASG